MPTFLGDLTVNLPRPTCVGLCKKCLQPCATTGRWLAVVLRMDRTPLSEAEWRLRQVLEADRPLSRASRPWPSPPTKLVGLPVVSYDDDAPA
jgi:hypothetical protein